MQSRVPTSYMKVPYQPAKVAALTLDEQPNLQFASSAEARTDTLYTALVVGAAFVLYVASAYFLELRKGTTHFGADAWYYLALAKGDVLHRITQDYYLDRVARFHPATVLAAAGWMQVFGPLERLVPAAYLLKAMFAAIGALGVWAAMWAYATVASRRAAILFGVVYATSLGVWYFSCIEESKILTASLSTLYVALYLHIRQEPTVRGVGLLAAVLFAACMNEVVSAFLVVVPLIDTVVRYGWDWRKGLWIPIHALVAPLSFLLMEQVMYGRMVGMSHPEGSTHFGMFFSYLARGDHSLGSLYAFVVNWLFFNMAAPSIDALYGVPAGANFKGYFGPSLMSYFTSLTSAGAALLFCVLLAAVVASRRTVSVGPWHGVLLGLAAYTLVRGVFFFLFNPYEPLLFSPAVTLAHLLLVGIPLAAAKFPAKPLAVGAFAALLFVANGAFIVFGQ